MNTVQRIFWSIRNRRRSSYLLQRILLPGLVLLLACTEKRKEDPCCTYTNLPASIDINDGHGLLQVEGSTSAYYYVIDDTGKQAGYQLLNETLSLEPGRYLVKVNNSAHAVEVASGRFLQCSTGTLIVSGKTSENYHVMDTVGQQLGSQVLSRPMSFFAGTFLVNVNSTEVPVDIRIKELTEIRTGTLVVKGTTGEYYYVLDGLNKQLNYTTLEKPLAFLPGSYFIKVNNTSMKADVFGGQVEAQSPLHADVMSTAPISPDATSAATPWKFSGVLMVSAFSRLKSLFNTSI